MEAFSEAFNALQPGSAFFLGPQHSPAVIRSVGDRMEVVKGIEVGGVTDRNTSETLRRQQLYLRFADVEPLPEDVYYHWELIGLRVIADDGEQLGELVQIIETGANDVYVVRDDAGKELLLPAIEDVVLNVEPQAGEIRVKLLPGLRP